jgi:Asp-tRNA(Asn)/Glu-tRNA(Gln) amidotransferase A subunit family amidase
VAGDDFEILEVTISGIRHAFQEKRLTARRLVQRYLDRIEAIDKAGPCLNSIISVNPGALAEADRLDEEFRTSGQLRPLHGIPIVLKDQCDVAGMPTTLGSVLFRDFVPANDAAVVARLRQAGAIVLAKSTLGEFGAGDAHGSLFGSTRNAFDLDRTSGGSSGGSGAAVSANLCAVALGQEGFSSIRRPAAWNGIAGMRPTAGLVSRAGVYNGWPSINGAVGPLARPVEDVAVLLDHMVGYDPADPLTAYGASKQTPYAAALAPDSLRGARLGILREPNGYATEPGSDDFRKVDDAFNAAVEELAACGATVIDQVVIPNLTKLLAMRARSEEEDEASFAHYFGANPAAPFWTRREAMASPQFASVFKGAQARWRATADNRQHYTYLNARDALMTSLLNVMESNRLDAIVHKAVEHQPTLIREGIEPPYRDQRGAIHINTFLVFVPAVVVPAGFTTDDLPTGITFMGRPYDDARMLSLAHGYERATRHRRPPPCAVDKA